MLLLPLSVSLLLLQSFDEINAYNLLPPRRVKQIYWEAAKTTEVILNLLPEVPKREQPMVRLVFQAFFPGREAKGAPVRFFIRAVPLPLTVILVRPSLRLVVDGEAVDLGPQDSQRLLYIWCRSTDVPCSADGVEIEVKPAVVRALVWGGSVEGTALGFPIRLSKADQAALFEFADRIGLISRTGRSE